MHLQFLWRFNIKGEAVFWIVSIIFILTGMVFTMGIPKIIGKDKELCTQKTTGNIIELIETKKYYYPVYEFKDPAGKILKYKSGSGSSNPIFRKGDLVEIFFNPANPEDFYVHGENDQLLYVFKIVGLVFFIMGGVILLLTLPSSAIKIFYPQNIDFWFWWVNLIGGMIGAFSFSLPSSFIWVIYFILPGKYQSAFIGKSFLLWIFTIVGILVNVGVYFIARSQLKGRPVWKKKK